MATCDHVDIAEAVKDSLTAAGEDGTFSQHVVVERKWWDTIKRELVAEAELLVMPQAESAEIISRQPTSLHDYDVQVVIRSRITMGERGPDADEMDAALLLCEHVKDHLRDNPGMASATLTGYTHEPLWDQLVLQDEGMFLAGMVFTYRLTRNSS